MGEIIYENEYGKFCIPESSKDGIAPEFHKRGQQHEADTVKFIMDNCSGGDVVHAGAYFGDFLPGLSMGVDRGRKVIAFEPCREHYECALRTLELNGIENVWLYNSALGERTVTKHLLTHKHNDLWGWIHEGGRSKITPAGRLKKIHRVEDVSVVTIDSVIKAPVSLIHLDVEHHEKQAIMGGVKTLKKYLPILIIENIGRHPLNIDRGAWLNSVIGPMGYRNYATVNQNIVFKVF